MPWLEGGPVELGEGDNVLYATQIIPDDKTLGDVTISFKTKFYPDDAETVFGPYTLASRTDVRFSGRQFRIRFDGVRNDDWRIGEPRVDAVQGGLR
jgi:hypothetical protein